jgi:transposase
MARIRREFSRELKLEAVRMVKSGDRPATAIARELGIRVNLLYRWVALLEEKGEEQSFPGNGKGSAMEEELRRLQRENARLREEREILKKATAFFAKESR